MIVKEINIRCPACKYQDTRQLDPTEKLTCPRCDKPLCVESFQEVDM